VFMLNGRSQKAANIDQTEELLRQYRTLTEVIPQIVWTAKPDGNVDYVNNRWYEFTGMDFEQTRDWGWQPALHPDDVEIVSLRWRESLASGEPFEAEMRFRRTDGVYHWHLVRALPLRDTSGVIVKWCGTNTDIHDQKTHIDELEARIIEDPAKLKQGPPPVLKSTFAERYIIEGVLSTGGMGSVYLARHIHMSRVVAIKILHPFLHGNLKLVKQFQQEAEAASGLIHPNIVTVFDFGISKSGEPFLVMDHIEGKSLEDVLNADRNIDLQRFLKLFIQVCDGLQEAHSKGIVHCDIKPGNIVIGHSEVSRDQTAKEIPKIIDFGIARINPRDVSVDQKTTMDFAVTGSPRYMSPEQCVGDAVDERSDLYSLGCVMYECITGRPVFEDISVYELFNKHVNYPPRPFAKVCPYLTLPASLEKLLFEVLEKSPEKRVQTAQEIRRRLLLIYREHFADV
jgi:PAS domain S-box-containing protein